MIRHIVWWQLKSQAEGRSAAENARGLMEASSALHGIPAARTVEFSVRIQPTSTVSAQVALMSTHDNMTALENYKNDPVHVKFAQQITTLSESRSCIDYEVD